MSVDLRAIWNIRANLYAAGLKLRPMRVHLYAKRGQLTDESLKIRAECESFFDMGDQLWKDAVRAKHGNIEMIWLMRDGVVDCHVNGATYIGDVILRPPVWEAVKFSCPGISVEVMDRLAIFIQFFDGRIMIREVAVKLDAIWSKQEKEKAAQDTAEIDAFESDLESYALSC